MLSEMGYRVEEFFGRYSFSRVKTNLSDYGLSSPSMHTDLETLTDHMGRLAETANSIWTEYLVLPAIPEERRQTPDNYRRMAESFSSIGEAAKRNGLKFAYHYYGYGFQPVDGIVPIDLIYEQTDPKLVYFELDLFWTASAGTDPAALPDKYSNRFRMLHIQDKIDDIYNMM